MESQLSILESTKSDLETSLQQCKKDMSSLQQDIDNSARDRETTESRLQQQIVDHTKQILGKVVWLQSTVTPQAKLL